MNAKVALVTGASSGIGEATALRLKEQGCIVYAAARRVDRMRSLARAGIHVLKMDVTDDASVQAGVDAVTGGSGRIDVLVTNAGYGSYGAVEEVPLAEAYAQFDVNVFGVARLTQRVLPHMRAQRSGTIVNITSMGGRMHTPLGAWYHGTKFALEGFSDCLRLEVAPFGIDVVIVEPGGIKTEWGGIAAAKLREMSGRGAYAEQASAMSEWMVGEASRKQLSPPELIADTIGRAVAARRPKMRYAVGFGAKPLILLCRLLFDRAFDDLMRRVAGFPRESRRSRWTFGRARRPPERPRAFTHRARRRQPGRHCERLLIRRKAFGEGPCSPANPAGFLAAVRRSMDPTRYLPNCRPASSVRVDLDPSHVLVLPI